MRTTWLAFALCALAGALCSGVLLRAGLPPGETLFEIVLVAINFGTIAVVVRSFGGDASAGLCACALAACALQLRSNGDPLLEAQWWWMLVAEGALLSAATLATFSPRAIRIVAIVLAAAIGLCVVAATFQIGPARESHNVVAQAYAAVPVSYRATGHVAHDVLSNPRDTSFDAVPQIGPASWFVVVVIAAAALFGMWRASETKPASLNFLTAGALLWFGPSLAAGIFPNWLAFGDALPYVYVEYFGFGLLGYGALAGLLRERPSLAWRALLVSTVALEVFLVAYGNQRANYAALLPTQHAAQIRSLTLIAARAGVFSGSSVDAAIVFPAWFVARIATLDPTFAESLGHAAGRALRLSSLKPSKGGWTVSVDARNGSIDGIWIAEVSQISKGAPLYRTATYVPSAGRGSLALQTFHRRCGAERPDELVFEPPPAFVWKSGFYPIERFNNPAYFVASTSRFYSEDPSPPWRYAGKHSTIVLPARHCGASQSELTLTFFAGAPSTTTVRWDKQERSLKTSEAGQTLRIRSSAATQTVIVIDTDAPRGNALWTRPRYALAFPEDVRLLVAAGGRNAIHGR